MDKFVSSGEIHENWVEFIDIPNFRDGMGRDDSGKSAYLISGTMGRSRKF